VHSARRFLLLRALGAFLALPGMVAFAVPLVIGLGGRHRPLSGGAVTIGAGSALVVLGTLLLLACIREFYIAGRGTLGPWDLIRLAHARALHAQRLRCVLGSRALRGGALGRAALSSGVAELPQPHATLAALKRPAQLPASHSGHDSPNIHNFEMEPGGKAAKVLRRIR
jgi:hypothetical protein